MTMRYALKEEKELFYNRMLAKYQGKSAFLDYYFKEIFEKGQHFVLDEGNIKALASVFKGDYHIGGKLLKGSYIAYLDTLEEEEAKSKLLKELLSVLCHQDLLTFIKPDDLKLYSEYDFKVAYRNRRYYFSSQGFGFSDVSQIKDVDDPKKLRYLYNRFSKLFSGYRQKDESYFKGLLTELPLIDHQIKIVYDSNHNPKGYFIYEVLRQMLVIHECVYLDTRTLNKILSYALSIKDNVVLTLSEYEKIEKVYEGIAYDLSDYMMVRINDYALFNTLYDVKVADPKSALTIGNKPLFLKEDF